MPKRLTVFMLIAIMTLAGITACGKRGAPYRPSEVPTQTVEG